MSNEDQRDEDRACWLLQSLQLRLMLCVAEWFFAGDQATQGHMDRIYNMMMNSMGRALGTRILRRNVNAVRMAIKAAGGAGGAGIWKPSTNEDPSAAVERLRQEEARRLAEEEAKLPAYMRARKAGRGQMLTPRTPDPWTRPKPAGYGFTVGVGPKR